MFQAQIVLVEPCGGAVTVDLSVITATYNERDNITGLIPAIFDSVAPLGIEAEVVIVDDHSPDGTADKIRSLIPAYPRIQLIERPSKLGIGSAYLTGVLKARGGAVVLMDADFSHPVELLPEFYAAALEGRIGWGVRFIRGNRVEMSFLRYWGSRCLNVCANAFFHNGVCDVSLGYLGLKTSLLREMIDYAAQRGVRLFESDLYGIAIAGVARRMNVPLVEIRSPYRKRAYGKTKMRIRDGVALFFKEMADSCSVARRLNVPVGANR